MAVGYGAGQYSQGTQSVALGMYAGYNTQGAGSVAIGYEAGYDTQGAGVVAVGNNAGKVLQQPLSVAVGYGAGQNNQGSGAIAIGNAAGLPGQGIDAIAIGNWAGYNSPQADHSIIIDATGNSLTNNNGIPSSCVIKPIRNLNGPATQLLYYSPGIGPGQDGEITWGTDSSSIRYKQDVVDLPTRYIDAIFNLRPVEFAFKSVPNKRTIGLIAEDVLEHVPEIVTHNPLDDTIIEGLDTERLVAPLVAIAQQQSADFKTLRRDVDRILAKLGLD